MRRHVLGTFLLIITGATALAMDYMNQWRLQNYAEGSVTPETYLAALPERLQTAKRDVSNISLGGSETVGSYLEGFKQTVALADDAETGRGASPSASTFSNRDIAADIRSGKIASDGLLAANAEDMSGMSPREMYRYTKRTLLSGGIPEAEAERMAREAAEGLQALIDHESTGN